MTELLGASQVTSDELNPSCGADESALAQALKDADAAASAADAAAALARARADRLRQLAQSATPDPADPGDAGEIAEADTDLDGQGADAIQQETTRGQRARSTRYRRRLGLICAAVITVMLCVTGAGSGYILWKHHGAVREREKTAEFVVGAREAVVALMSLGFQNAKQGAQRVVDDSTGEFRDDFTKHLNDFTKDLEQAKVATTVTVNGAAVQSIKGDSAKVLVAVTSEVSNSAGAQHEPRAWRLIVTVTRDGGKPKMSKLEFVP